MARFVYCLLWMSNGITFVIELLIIISESLSNLNNDSQTILKEQISYALIPELKKFSNWWNFFFYFESVSSLNEYIRTQNSNENAILLYS